MQTSAWSAKMGMPGWGGVNSGQQFAVQWGEQQTCNITLPELLDIATEQLLLPCH